MSTDGTDPAFTTPDQDGTELLGTVIADRYHLECVLGRGGMGLVYRAEHLGLRRQVAVKILHPSLASSPDVRSRFEREAYAAGRIDHPNCINVMDSGKLRDGTRYLAMELLEGKSLADVLEAEGQLAPGRALHILAHVLRGLGHIHQAGLIHRDIKPENIFLIRMGTDEDFAKILDFGIAKAIGGAKNEIEDVKLTQAGMAFGTPIYMAPEQALGNPMDGRADLYAAAVLGYEMLAGQPPFYSDDKLEVMSMHTAKPVPPMRQRLIKGGRPVPSSLERLIAKGLTKKPSDRYESAEVFLAAVEDALDTPDGGVTDVSIERFDTASVTGSQPLVTLDGRVNVGTAEVDTASIADAIEDALASPSLPPKRTTPVPAPPVVPVMPTARTAPPRGGVGLGLPYTGPAGEPIFGLTPEQRLAQVPGAAAQDSTDRSQIAPALEPDVTRPAPRSRRMFLYGGILAVAVVAGVVIAVLTARGGDDTTEAPTGIDPASPAGRALVLKKNGKLDEARALLEGAGGLEADGEMQLVLGHLLVLDVSRDERPAALAAYSKALSLRPDLGGDDELQLNLRTMAGTAEGAVLANAFDLWVRTPDPEAKPALLNAAVADKMERRRAVVPVIERHKLEGQVEWYRAYTLDLQQELTCPQRKQAVAKLRALKDPRAIPALEQAIEKRVKQNPRVKLNACLIEDAKAAIGFLSAQSKKTP